MTGIALFYDRIKGFGFVAPSDCTEDIFFHHSALGDEPSKNLEKGQAVEFEIGFHRGRRVALHITPVASENGGSNERS
jgi:CspA family cold shock protein